MTDPWEEHAAWWQREFTDGADLEYVEQIMPMIREHLPGRGVMLDIGCGEGQVSRLAVEEGMTAVGVDQAEAQLTVARKRGGGAHYVQGAAIPLPIATGSVDAAVACLVIEHIPGLDAALDEVARVLRPGGSFLLLMNHPLIQTPGSGWIDDRVLDPPERYWRVGPYLDEGDTMEQVDKDVYIRFWHRPLHRYLNSARRAGLVLEHMEEPPPPPGFLEPFEEDTDSALIPRMMFLRFSRT